MNPAIITNSFFRFAMTSGSLPQYSDSFADLPTFPKEVPTAPLLRLSLQLLRTSDDESNRLWSASTNLGFFYLDLRGDDAGEQLLKDSAELFKLGMELFDLGREKLGNYDYKPIGSYFGYKGFGKGVVDTRGNLDRNEFYNVSIFPPPVELTVGNHSADTINKVPKDDFLGISKPPLAHPELLHEQSALLLSYMNNAHALLTFILDQLSSHLNLPKHVLRDIHAQTLASGDHIRIVKSPPNPSYKPSDPSMGAHTDFGSLTLLMNRLGGLQVLPPGSAPNDWLYVQPLPGHAIINLGDALVKFTNGLLKSNIHRVVAPPGEQAKETRYSLVYFMRPGDEVPLKRLDGSNVIPKLKAGEMEEDINSKDWIKDKAFARRVGVYKGPETFDKRRETSGLAAAT
jgi:isopenicillin N synthase-like dioxygenase